MIDRKIFFLLSEVKPAGLSVSVVQHQCLQREWTAWFCGALQPQQLLPALLCVQGS